MTFAELIAKKEVRKTELRSKIAAAKDVEEMRSITAEILQIDQEITDMRAAAETEAATARASQEVLAAAARSGRGIVNINGVYQLNENRGSADPLDSAEYRQAFMTFLQTGQVTDALKPGERRDTTIASDVGYVIPLSTLNEVFAKKTVYGSLYRRVRQLNVPGGLAIPLITVKPTATWIGDGNTTTAQKQAAGSVLFSYFGLECKVATSLLVNIASVSAFYAKLVELIAEAIMRALDIGIVSGAGAGSNQMTGITVDTNIPAGNVVTLAAADFNAWDGWKKKVFAKMPAAYRAGASFVMAAGTWEGYIDGMVDANGQPVGRMNYGITEGTQERFGGREVVIVENDVVANYDDAAVNAVVAIYGNLQNYGVNSNMAMTMYRYLWQETNQWMDKGILICDGKVIDPNGFIIIKKGA